MVSSHFVQPLADSVEGLNGRLPNQDVINSIAHISRWAGGVHTRIHDLPDSAARYGPSWLQDPLESYLVGARHLWDHFTYAALGRASGGHGVLAK